MLRRVVAGGLGRPTSRWSIRYSSTVLLGVDPAVPLVNASPRSPSEFNCRETMPGSGTAALTGYLAHEKTDWGFLDSTDTLVVVPKALPPGPADTPGRPNQIVVDAWQAACNTNPPTKFVVAGDSLTQKSMTDMGLPTCGLDYEEAMGAARPPNVARVAPGTKHVTVMLGSGQNADGGREAVVGTQLARWAENLAPGSYEMHVNKSPEFLEVWKAEGRRYKASLEDCQSWTGPSFTELVEKLSETQHLTKAKLLERISELAGEATTMTVILSGHAMVRGFWWPETVGDGRAYAGTRSYITPEELRLALSGCKASLVFADCCNGYKFEEDFTANNGPMMVGGNKTLTTYTRVPPKDDDGMGTGLTDQTTPIGSYFADAVHQCLPFNDGFEERIKKVWDGDRVDRRGWKRPFDLLTQHERWAVQASGTDKEFFERTALRFANLTPHRVEEFASSEVGRKVSQDALPKRNAGLCSFLVTSTVDVTHPEYPQMRVKEEARLLAGEMRRAGQLEEHAKKPANEKLVKRLYALVGLPQDTAEELALGFTRCGMDEVVIIRLEEAYSRALGAAKLSQLE